MSRHLPTSLLLLTFTLIGCAAEPSSQSRKAAQSADNAAPEAAPAGAPKAEAGNKAAPVKSMIIYTYTLDVVVKDLEPATAELEKLVVAHKGYIAKSELRGNSGSRRSATYTLRIPVGADQPVRTGLLALGVPERNAVETQDVGEEFVDVEKRIKNLREQEDKLNELLKDKRKEEKLEDVIKVSDRIYVVRGEIERAQGRREYLLNRTAFSTMHVTLSEIKDYKPPTAPTFGNRVSSTFQNSWEGLVNFGQSAALFAVALVPWLPLVLLAVAALFWARRRLRRTTI